MVTDLSGLVALGSMVDMQSIVALRRYPFPLSEAASALTLAESRTVAGKVILVPGRDGDRCRRRCRTIPMTGGSTMSTATLTAPTTAHNATVTTRPAGEVDNRATYVSFGLAYVLGHGAAAVSNGPSPRSTYPAGYP